MTGVQRFSLIVAPLLIAANIAAWATALSAAPDPAPSDPASRLRAQLRHEREAWRAERRRLVRVARHTPSVSTALTLASVMTGVSRPLLDAIAFCESGRRPWARNPSGASGLAQFMPRTWAGNHIGSALGPQAVWDPYVSAMAAAWAIRSGGTGPWIKSRHCWGRRVG